MLRLLTRRLPPYKAGSFSAIHECPDCGLFSGLVPPKVGNNQYCPRCTKVLRRSHFRPLDKATACYISAAFFYLLTITTPLLHIILYGRVRSSELYTGPLMLDSQDLWQVATLVLLTTLLMPLVKIAGYLTVLVGIRLRHRPRWLGHLFAWLKHMDSWTMIEVYMLGFLVAYTRMQVMAHVILGPAVYGMIGLMLSLVAADTVLDSEAVWERIPSRHKRAVIRKRNAPLLGCDTCHLVCYDTLGNQNAHHKTAHCPRCGETLHKRKPSSLSRTWALVLAAVVLYLPSNIYPIMTVVKLGKAQSYTIIGGMMELVHVRLLPLAILVFCASIVIPIFKLLSLGFLLISTHRGSRWQLHHRTQLYRIIDFIGRWSMVDVFMVSILVALVHFGLLADVVAEPGAIYFASVVILTMMAVKCFDPRLMWDAADEAAPQPVTASKKVSFGNSASHKSFSVNHCL